ncbi:hypothetical protein SAMN04490355_10095 [Pelosinus propionicus DSM 13327]|uniref:Uncharacterized protein n=2 Tax=Pelosinus TaxID=365348 RepID=A0A1I4IPM2_9FIRM|nr:hypothetical protein SAMN04490355_10095 [Pelosinus propionicus DSM 13327]
MKNHLYYLELNAEQLGKSSANLERLGKLLRPDRDIDIKVKEMFPISNLGHPTKELKIKGSKVLLTEFKQIDIEAKFDKIEALSNIDYIGLTDKGEIILNFKDDKSSSTGIYDFTYEFFEVHFHMGKYANFCIKNNFEDLIKENVQELLVKLGSVEKQYRFIVKNDEVFLRGLTSKTYRNYNNNIALFISLLYLNKFAIENEIVFSIEHARISDSAIKIILEQENAVSIPGVGKVYFGIVISNSEIKQSTFSLEIRYKLVDEEDSTKSFTAIPVLRDSIFNVYHNTGIAKLEEKVGDINTLKNAQNSILTLIKEIKEIRTISDDTIFNLFRKITNNQQNFKAETRQNMQELYEKNIINNTLNLIQAFDKTTSITSDFDERVFLERIYHELISDLIKRKQKNKEKPV